MILVSNLNSNIRKIGYNEYIHLFINYGSQIITDAQREGRFVIDGHNQTIIDNMYLWLTRHPKCPWNVDKAFYLCGAIGCGKTTLMKTFLAVVNDVSDYIIPMYQSYLFHEEIRKYGLTYFKTRPIFIDELGREQLEIYANGVRVRPMEDLIGLRYEYGAATFFTSNFKLETLSQGYDENGKKIGYGKYIGDRIGEMCNIIVVPGCSRRK